jgi:hypothetical protein
MFDMIVYLAQFLIYALAIFAISYCFFVVFKKSNNDDDDVATISHQIDDVDNVDCSNEIEKIKERMLDQEKKFEQFSVLNQEIEKIKQKMTERNKKFDEAIAQVDEAAIVAKIRTTKLEILGQCANINGRIVEYLHTESSEYAKKTS